MWRHCCVALLLSVLAAPAEAIPAHMRLAQPWLIEKVKGGVVLRPARTIVVRKSTRLSLSVSISRRESGRTRKKTYAIPDIPKRK